MARQGDPNANKARPPPGFTGANTVPRRRGPPRERYPPVRGVKALLALVINEWDQRIGRRSMEELEQENEALILVKRSQDTRY